jgi:hypothetical protein
MRTLLRSLHAAAALALWSTVAAPSRGAEPAPIQHEAVGRNFIPSDVDFAHPVYRTEFDDPAERRDWVLEGGRSLSIAGGRLILESAPHADPAERSTDHLVCWLKREVPADFLLEVAVRPQNKRDGLNIIFFNTRGVRGESIFDASLQRRDGTFRQYHSGDLNGYHVSYWAAPRGTTHIRKNRGFHLVATSEIDPIANAAPDTFETLRIYKRGNVLRVMVNDRIIVAWDDDGVRYGPVLRHPGWIGLRQMGHTLRCEYERLAVFPLKPAGTQQPPKK